MIVEETLYADRFRLIRQIGCGGSSEVWLAEDIELAEEVALKFPSWDLSQTHLELLKRETRQARQLSHRHILRTYDLILPHEDRAAISLEYAPGGSLIDLMMKQKRCFEPSEIEPWIEQTCEALMYLHSEKGLVHRDLKPGNLFLGGDGKIRLGDFGISAFLELQMDDATRKTLDNRLTLHFASPQQIADPTESRPDNDIYSLGVTVFNLLTGSFPFKDPLANRWPWDPGNLISMNQTRQRRGHGEPSIAQRWEYAVAKCLAENPGDRPGSARDFAGLIRLESPVALTPLPAAGFPLHSAETEQPTLHAAKRRPWRRLGLVVLIILSTVLTGVAAGLTWGLLVSNSASDVPKTAGEASE
ncbi:MAG: serine/threonine-protein kinase [Verrucomicrobiota bacterium]